jgi:hypothetical protein
MHNTFLIGIYMIIVINTNIWLKYDYKISNHF